MNKRAPHTAVLFATVSYAYQVYKVTKGRTIKNLGDITFSALLWTYGGNIVGIAFQFVISIVLARLLDPSAFGLMAIAGILLGFGRLFADVGLGPATIQRQDLKSEDICFVFWCQMAAGIVLSLLVFSSAGLYTRLFGEPEQLTTVVQAISVIFVVQAVGLTAEHLLRRDVNFKVITLTQVATYVVSFGIVGVTAALMGFGVWSLVAANIVQAVLTAAILLFLCRHPIGFRFKPESSGLIDFGLKAVATNILNWAITVMDTAFIGRVAGTDVLGLYNRAQFLVLNPTSSIATALQRIMFSSYSRAQDKTDTARMVYLASITFVGLALMPILLTIAAVPETVLIGLLGNKWEAAAIFLTPLALAMIFHSLMSLAGPLVWGQGRVDLALRAQGTTLVAFVAVLIWAAGQSTQMMAWGVVSAYAVRFALLTRHALDLLSVRWLDVMRSMSGPSLIAVATAGAVYSVDLYFTGNNMAAIPKLLVDVATGLASLILFSVLFHKLLLTWEVKWLVNRFSHKYPSWLFEWLIKFGAIRDER